VLHLYMAERAVLAEACRTLVRRALENFRLPYLTVTPTFSICPVHGYLAGEHEFCPKCDGPASALGSPPESTPSPFPALAG
jgi:anaerobic ribonucleoside-triphosphate reductase